MLHFGIAPYGTEAGNLPNVVLGSLDNLRPVVSKQMPISACSVGLVLLPVRKRVKRSSKESCSRRSFDHSSRCLEPAVHSMLDVGDASEVRP